MSEWTQREDDQDPEPIRNSDAQRITEDEAQQVPTRGEDEREGTARESGSESD